ncbi:hypothetical protein [Lentiprolixibacter aurantiacus]|uniref:Uncharacterized protein n=1 Tax=Lentiprolixibacter aurantiacus TaxID=2993939 RepID=A0AAE3SM73_9FLAO|nr:hypothetical protein [Lentiprolixibacter aurantiacus]MCX2717976.1 hypothetical protein [Lentiprolixibacter aurantiacus]
MIRYPFFLALLSLLIINCSPGTERNTNLHRYIPKDASLLLQVRNLSNFKSNLRNCEYLSQISAHPLLTPEELSGGLLNYVESDSSALISLINWKDKKAMLIASWVNTNKTEQDSTAADPGESVSSNGVALWKHLQDSLTWYSTTSGGIKLWSLHPEVLSNILKQDQPADAELSRLLRAANDRSSASLFRKASPDPYMHFFPFTEEEASVDSVQPIWQVMDLEFRKAGITGSGVVMIPDSGQTWASYYRGTVMENRIAALAPLQSDAIISFILDTALLSSEIPQDSLELYEEEQSLLNAVASAGVIIQNKQRWVVLDLLDASGLETLLKSLQVGSRQFQGSEILELGQGQFLDAYTNKVVKGFDARFATRIENQFIFAESSASLELLLQDYNRGMVFEMSSLYENSIDLQSGEASLQFTANAEGMGKLLQEPLFAGTSPKNLSLFPEGYVYSGQVLSGSGHLLNNMAINRINKKAESNTTSEEFRLQLDAEVATIPQFVINHRNRQKEIVVQDETNKLYLISGEGKVLWKKQLDSRIQGEIKQVDLYKNGRLQLAFTTNNQFLVLDRNGKEVLPFNMRFKGGNLNPLAVFDYENNRNYRFVVTQGRKIYMYNRRGQIVSGYTYTEAAAPVLREPQHFRIGSRDYLVFQLENGALEIRNRVGKTRIPVSERFQFSENPVYMYLNQFSFTDNSGRLYSIDTKGKLSASKLNLDALHRIDATSKTLVTLSENTLTIKGRPITLDLGVYTGPKIFYLYDKIYVSVTDLQAEKVYLFDSQTKSIPGFPVFGTDAMRLDDVDNDRNLELVTSGQANDLILYRMN